MNKKLNKEDPLPPDTAVPIRPRKQKILAVIIIAAVLACGWFVSRSLLNSKPEVNRRQPAAMKTVVQVQQLKATDLALEIEAMGTVIAAQKLDLKPRVSGRVVEVNPKLVPGSLLNKDDRILKIDKKDYELALERSRNNLQKASMDLRLEQGNQAVAKREFDLIREYASTGLNDAPLDLALRKPQLAKATAAEATARTQMQQAQLDLDRTVLRVPFNGVVLEKNVAVGAQISQQTTVAKLAGTNEFWIRITIPRHDLTDILLPSADSVPIQVTVLPMSERGNTNKNRQGTILRLLPDVDPQGLMARLLISVSKPQLYDTENPLLLGSMVKVLLPGKTINACFAVPRTTVRPDNTVLLADPDNRLEIRSVTVARMDRDLAYITAGLADGEQLIVSPVPAPISGMKLSPATGNKPAAGHSAP
ncbi:MAG: efflux RND transporter periplasmic adaptor subunit [Thermodesulfobacteriota bacterium]|nr:efflux RND transporter periplasmic adaptor subunit [Thermodesulfobacteriota bacterium]